MRTGTTRVILSNGTTAQGQPRLQQRGPVGRMLFVEEHMTAVIQRRDGRAAGGERAASQVQHFGRRREEDAATAGAKARTKIHVLFVHEEPFVEQAGFL